MTYLNVLTGAAAAWVWGAIWYAVMARSWAEAAGIADKAPGVERKIGAVVSFVAMLFVAGMMRHMFNEAGIAAVGKGALAGIGIGLFIVTPFVAMNYYWAGRPVKLTLIDGVNAAVSCGLIGVMLTAF